MAKTTRTECISQFPIDTKNGAWLELIMLNAEGEVLGVAAAMLAVGDDVNITLSTDKGDLEIAHAEGVKKEYWFSPSSAKGVAITEDHASMQLRIRGPVSTDCPDIIEGWINDTSAIDSLEPVLTGAAGKVDWSAENLDAIDDHHTFVTTLEGIEWGLTIAQQETALAMVHLTHNGEAGCKVFGPFEVNDTTLEAGEHEPRFIFHDYK